MQDLLNYLKEHQLVSLLVSAVIVFAVVLIILKVSRKLFRKLREKQSHLDLHFSEKIFRFLVIFISVMWLVMSNDLTKSFGASLFQSTAVIAAIAGSPCAVPGKPGKKEGESDYAPVYFLGFKDSSLDMATTVYYKPTTPTEVLKNDINTRVRKALEENGIEIPYNYLNVNLRETARQA